MTVEAASDSMQLYVFPRDEIKPAFAEASISLFFGCDDTFLAHAMTAIASILANAAANNNYDILVMQSGIARRKMAMATAWIRKYPNASLRFVDIGGLVEAVGREKFRTTREYSLAVYFRIFAPTVFANYDRMLYLDSDVVALRDVAGLYRQELTGNLLGACHDFVAECQSASTPTIASFWREELGMEPGSHYFNSGVLLMDLAGMRQVDTQSAMLDKINAMGKVKLPDQDVMNSVLYGRVAYLGCEWNYFDWMSDTEESAPGFQRIDENARQQIRAKRDAACIIHYAARKPWTVEYLGKNETYYWKYAAMTPFYREIMDRLNSECTFFKLIRRHFILSLQTVNYRLRSLFCPAEKKQQYTVRIFNLELRKRGIIKHMRRMRNL